MKRQILTIISLILTIGMILPTANAEETRQDRGREHPPSADEGGG